MVVRRVNGTYGFLNLKVNTCYSRDGIATEIMLILITIILLFNFEENISYVFLFFRIPLSFYGLLCFVLERKREKKPYNKLTSIRFVYMRLPDLRCIARCTRECLK